jgi:protein SCO1
MLATAQEAWRGMTRRRSLLSALLMAVFLVHEQAAHTAPVDGSRLPMLGPAPTFALDSSRGKRVALSDLRGKVLLVTFVFTTCSDSCPILTAKLAEIGRALGSDFGTRYAFVAITVDPLNDTPARLRTYAASFGADTPGWHFLTGTPSDISGVVRRYGAYAKKIDGGGVDHLFLTSLVDRAGRLRVQYLGTRFDPREMQQDLQMLSRE